MRRFLSELNILTDGRTSENGKGFKPVIEGWHVRGGVNLSMSNVRFSNDPYVVNRIDVVNLLDTWIVDLLEGFRCLQNNHVDVFETSWKTVIGSMYRVLQKIDCGYPVFGIIGNVRVISEYAAVNRVDYVINLRLWKKSVFEVYQELKNNSDKEVQKRMMNVIDSMRTVLFKLASALELKKLSLGEIILDKE